MTKERFVDIMKRLCHARLKYSPSEKDSSFPDFLDTWFRVFETADEKLFAKAIFDIMLTEESFPSIAGVKKYMVKINTEKTKKLASDVKMIEKKPNPEAAEKIREICRDLLTKIKKPKRKQISFSELPKVEKPKNPPKIKELYDKNGNKI